MIKIGVDANGGDFGIKSTVPGAIRAIEKYDDIEIVLYGDEAKIKPLLTNSERITIVDAKETISMGEEDPFRAVRRGKETSLVKAMYGAKTKDVDAIVTSGPTQCVVMASHIIVKRLAKMERVALCPIVPNRDGNPRLMLDVGANVELKPEHLGQFAIFGSVAAKEILGIENPNVGYLNIGSEPGKGRQLDKEAFQYLSNLDGINFYGNVEGDALLDSPVSVILAEGYGGNIALKTAEGTLKTFGRMLKDGIKSSFMAKIGYIFMKKTLKDVIKKVSSNEIGGAMIFGVDSNIVKAHGNSDDTAIMNAIKQARSMVKANIIEKVLEKLPENIEVDTKQENEA